MSDLATLANVKAYLSTGERAMNSRDDELLVRLIGSSSDFIESWLARSIALGNFQEMRDGPGGERPYRMQLAEYPIVSVQSLAIRGWSWGWGAPQVIPQVDFFSNGPGYFIEGDNSVILLGYRFPRGVANVLIQYTAGYASIPADIQEACIKMVALQYKERTRLGIKTVNIGGVESVTYDTSMFSVRDMSDVEMLLWQYRRPATIKRAIRIPPPPTAIQLEDTSTVVELESGAPILTEPG